MKISLLLILGVLSLNPILGQVLEDNPQRRYSRSVVNMDELLKLEEDLLLNLEAYIAELIQKYNTVQWGIRMMSQRHHLQEEEGPKMFWESPFNSYSLIRHMQSDWHMWQLYMEKPVGLEQLTYLESKKPTMPQDYDFHDAAEGIRRMQWTYKLLAKDISQGLLDGVQYNSSLSALDCLALAEHVRNDSRWITAGKWTYAGIAALQRPDPQAEIQGLRGLTMAQLYRTLAQVCVDHGRVEDALKAYQAALSHSPQDAELLQESLTLERKVLTLPGTLPAREEEEDYGENSRLPHCCNGRCALPLAPQLYCFWNTKSHPFLRLAPIKTELLSLHPYVVLLHDVVSEAERELIREDNKQHLLPSSTVDITLNTSDVAKYRTSKSVWLEEGSYKATDRLSVLLQDATGLDMEHSELFQVMNYGVGGLFESHIDSLLEDQERFKGKPDRLATTLFYLSEVPQGGATYFPLINLIVFPQPGSALFWYNLDSRGNEEKLTLHTGCPVIVGSKWVMSKWIYDQGQELRKPCSIQQ